MTQHTNHKTVYRQEGRLMLYLGVTTKEALKEWAERAGESLNCFVKRAVRRRIDYEKRKAAKAKNKEETR